MTDQKYNKKDLCIIHIGMPKTGTSALQSTLFNRLSDPNVSYAKFPVENHSAIIFSMFATHPETHGLHQGLEHTLEQIHAFNQKNKELFLEGFLKTDSQTEIISGEDIFHIDKEGLERMKQFFSQYFYKIMIVGYVRAPKSFMESAFQQLVKNHSLDRFDFSLIYPHYRLKFEKFDQVFGKENVNLWKFDPKQFPQNDITLDFCHRLNIQMDEQKVARENDAISREAISLLFANHKYGEKIDFGSEKLRLNNLLIQEISKIGSTKMKFSRELMNQVFKIYGDDLQWIENRMGVLLYDNTDTFDQGISTEEEILTFSDETIIVLNQVLKQYNISEEVGDGSPYSISKSIDALKLAIATKENIKILKKYPDEYYVLKKYQLDWSNYYQINSIKDLDMDPILHYIENWQKLPLVVDKVFNTKFYLNLYPDVKNANINPLIHYLKHGKKKGRKGMESI